MASRALIFALAATVMAAPAAEPEAAPSPVELAERADITGAATYYYQYNTAGSCGTVHKDSDYIVALSPSYMSNKANCGKSITVTNIGGGQDNNGKGKSITVKVADTCEGCEASHIDFATGPFKALTGGNLDPPGKFNIKWHFN